MAIIFDFDGTIADSFAGLHVFKKLHLNTWKIPFLLIRARHYFSQRINKIKLQPGIVDVIHSLQPHNQLFIISSNNRRNIERFLEYHGLLEAFADIHGSGGWNKAHLLKQVVEQHRLDPATTWLIGDEVRDIEAAHEVGLPVIAVSWGFNTPVILQKHQPTHLVKTPAELLKLLQ